MTDKMREDFEKENPGFTYGYDKTASGTYEDLNTEQEFQAFSRGYKAATELLVKKLAEQQALLCAENRGVIIDGLMLERDRSLARKSANVESNSNITADMCAKLITALGAAYPSSEELTRFITEAKVQALMDCIQMWKAPYNGESFIENLRRKLLELEEKK